MIHVCLMKRAGRRCYEVQWTDPITERKRTKTTNETDRRAAERVRARVEVELNDGRGDSVHKLTWTEFVEAYRLGKVNPMKPGSQESINGTISHINKIVKPARPTALGVPQIREIEAALLRKGLKPVTIHRHLAAIRRMLEWGRKRNYLQRLPEIDPPKFKQRQKSRPITEAEFESMLAELPNIEPALDVERWTWRLRGLWLSSLRITEAIALHWTDPTEFCVDLDGEFPVFQIQADLDKGTETRVFPMAKDFAQYLAAVPDIDRTGHVFDFTFPDGRLMSRWDVTRIVTDLAKRAKVVVAKGQHAGCHTFRRSFGERWSWKVKPRTLKLLMRHKTAATTEQYYQSHDTQETAREVWAAMGGDARTTQRATNKVANKSRRSRPDKHSRARSK